MSTPARAPSRLSKGPGRPSFGFPALRRSPLSASPSGVGAIALLTAVLLGSCGGPETTAAPRGVLLISIDSLRADHLGSYGYRSPTRPGIPTTPAMDRILAAEGTSFDRVYSTTNWTLPSHMGMLTGRPDELHGVRDLPDRLPASVPLLQERFRDANWRTAGFWSGPNLHPWFGFNRGFEDYVDCSSHAVGDPSVFALDDAESDYAAVFDLYEDSHQGATGPTVVASFEEWFQGVDASEPFFAFVHLWDVHYDYTPPSEFDVFDPDYRGKVDGKDFMNLRIKAGAKRDLNHLIALYDGELRFTDHNVERILTLLEKSGRLDDTLVVLTADHGEAFAEHGRLGHRHSLYEEETHVPLILRLPDAIPAGARVPSVASIADIAPTILDYCDLPALEGMWGQSLRALASAAGEGVPNPLLRDGAPRPAPLEWTSRIEQRVQRATRHERLKVIDNGEELLLFDLAVDPREQRPLSAEDRDKPVVASIVDGARDLWGELDATAAELDLSVTPGELPAGLSKDLSAAGYMGDDADDGAPDQGDDK